MKIAFIRDEYHPYGGAEKFSNLLMQRLAAKGAEIHIIARNWPDDADPNIFFHRIKGPAAPSLLRHLMFMRRVDRILNRYDFDVIQSNERLVNQDIFRAGDGVHAAWLDHRRRHCGFLKKISIMINPYHRLICRLERRMFENSNLKAVVTNSNMVRKDILSKFQIKPSKVHTIYNGVDLTRFHPANRDTIGNSLRQSRGIAPGVPVVLFVGSDFERKGVPSLIKAAANISDPFHLWIVGKGNIEKYQNMSRRLGVSQKIVFYGPQKDVAPFYAAADIFAFPTIYDPFPNVVIEAMASGLPVITTSRCGAAEIIRQGKEGFIIDSPWDVVGLATFLQKLFDRRFRENMSSHAVRRVKCVSIQDTVNRYDNLYHLIATVHNDTSRRPQHVKNFSYHHLEKRSPKHQGLHRKRKLGG